MSDQYGNNVDGEIWVPVRVNGHNILCIGCTHCESCRESQKRMPEVLTTQRCPYSL